MKYFKDEENVYAYASDGSEDGFIKPGLIAISETEALAIVNPPPTYDELIISVERTRADLLAAADAMTADWRTELLLGDISDNDKESLSNWLAYKRDVKAIPVEVAIVDGFKWPALPA